MDIKLIVLDVDGVMTDGSIYYDSEGREYKRFNVKDGFAIKYAIQKSITFAVITGRISSMVEKRCGELGINYVFQNVEDKVKVCDELVEKLGITYYQVAYMGDDIPDLPLLKKVGFSGAPIDAVRKVKKEVDFVSVYPGGKGAVREFIERIIGEIE
ncbi:KdsC family phosphatase [Desulfurobacterium atlanticum]|uniref:3-deoxy-D-manno-octulosonate 8-phosphate phosphatase (KDO 8-P phosphatase) n=1 Tax=Desulfurobacterium atlanticum TaxID=240169 RepID=A0A238XRW8_9BACT|nr:HAD-IIIA family hydrolase [Desulfurobacterium atlanticum]SNR61735.1 3-deoxy-D-manno-octulosonate 8-phosphate phosphatase (KDO 8-P phosphatase) [Desulfurobacterium atlanticum]